MNSFRSIAKRSVTASLFSVGVYGLATTLTAPGAKVDFEHDVQPILSAHCVRCHAHDLKNGGLALDTDKAVMAGGGSGQIVVAGKSGQSLLLDRILGKRGLPRMPMGFGPLNDHDTSIIQRWIDEGCVISTGKRTHWAYVKPVRPPVPKFADESWVRNPIDAFVLKKLHSEGLKPSPEADKTTLIRRLSLDLIGLPPTPKEVDAFLADRSPNAYDRVVDRLFANPHYGERMAIPWLDAARYADSNGFQQDGDTYQYVWRDWVVKAMNENMPFDQFTVQQLAGDLLPGVTTANQAGIDKLVATGFNRDNMLNGEGGAIPEEQRNVELFDRVDATATTWLGLTMACARCHDHKYDPFTQRDYYSMMAFFNQVPETGIPSNTFGNYFIAEPWIYAGDPAQMAKLHALEPEDEVAKSKAKEYEQTPQSKSEQSVWENAEAADVPVSQKLPKDVLSILKKAPAARTSDEAGKLRDYYLDHGLTGIAKADRDKWHALDKELSDLQTAIPKVMVMSDREPRKTHIYSRGNYTAPLAEVTSNTPASLCPMPKGAPKNRLGLAEWIMSPDNPLTARVQVNRIWQIFFGKGLVKTPENFGVQAEPPTNPELLDWLAVEFRESGWNVKRLQRLIVTSSTYRQTSKISKLLAQKDPENRFLARGARFRLPSMLIRDEALAACGLLNPKMGGKPVYPYQPKGIWDGLNITDERDFTYPQSKGPDLYRRSIYTFWRRTVGPGDMFDASSRQVCTVRLSQTSTPLHALTTLNDEAWVEAGRVLGESVIREEGSDPNRRITEAFRRVCARRPNPKELTILRRDLDRALTAFRQNPKDADAFLKLGASPRDSKIDPTEDAAYATVCLTILNLDEALTRE